MEIRRLSYFIRIAEDGSLTRAAGMVRVAQSALSRQMRLLEEDLGVTLFDRTARGMRLTGEGERLRASVAGPLRELELAIQGIRSGAQAAANLALGLPPSLADLLARPLATELHAAFPDICFRLVEGPTGGLVDWLGRGMIDFAILEETGRNDLLVEQQLLTLPFVLVGAPDGDGPEGKDVDVEIALRLPLVVPSHHLGIRAAINDAARRHQARLNTRFEADSARLIKDLVRDGIGYALLPASYVRQEVGDGLLRQWSIADPALNLEIHFSSRKASQSAGRQFTSVMDFITAAILQKLK